MSDDWWMPPDIGCGWAGVEAMRAAVASYERRLGCVLGRARARDYLRHALNSGVCEPLRVRR